MQVTAPVCYLMSSALFLLPFRLEAEMAQDLLCIFMAAFGLQAGGGARHHIEPWVWFSYILCVVHYFSLPYMPMLMVGFFMLGSELTHS